VKATLNTYLRYVKNLDFFEKPDYDYLRKVRRDLFRWMSYIDDNEFYWTKKTMSTPVGSPSTNQAVEAKPLGQPNRHQSGLKKKIAEAFFLFGLSSCYITIFHENREHPPYIGFYIFPLSLVKRAARAKRKKKIFGRLENSRNNILICTGTFFGGSVQD
jgi:hypothetical protein